jgi:creatinine amidohydrolase
MVEDVVEYQYLLPYQFEERMERCPLVYVPVGSLEWHGEHMALGNDTIKIHALCCEAARVGGGIVFPPIYYGIPFMVAYGARYQYKANVPVTEDLLRSLLDTTLRALEEVGFKAAILITGHTCRQQRELMRDIANHYLGEMALYGTDDIEWAGDIEFTSDHAAKWETSILWYLRPELVDIYRLPKDLRVELEGIGGDDPRVYASRQLGKNAVKAIARDLARLGADLLAQGAPGKTSEAYRRQES